MVKRHIKIVSLSLYLSYVAAHPPMPLYPHYLTSPSSRYSHANKDPPPPKKKKKNVATPISFERANG